MVAYPAQLQLSRPEKTVEQFEFALFEYPPIATAQAPPTQIYIWQEHVFPATHR